MAIEPSKPARRLAALRLEPFDPAYAELVASWVRDEHEAYWLAPKTTPPITADRVRAWKVPGHHPLQLVERRGGQPLAYGEINVLNRVRGRLWLGHLIIDPSRRGRGIGHTLTRLLLERAFLRHGANRVSLVVFPENEPAIRCYQAAGMCETGYEQHELPAYGQRVSLLRLTITRGP